MTGAGEQDELRVGDSACTETARVLYGDRAGKSASDRSSVKAQDGPLTIEGGRGTVGFRIHSA
jgi:hypothetical protein